METSSRIWSNFKLIQARMYVIVTCKYEQIRSRTAEKKWQHRFSHYFKMLTEKQQILNETFC